MPDNRNLSHINLNGFYSVDRYTSPQSGSNNIQLAHRSRRSHGRRLLDQLETIKDRFEFLQDQEYERGIVFDDAIYVEFVTEINFKTVFDSFDSERGLYKLLKIDEIQTDENGVQYSLLVMLREGGISSFIRKVEQYINEDTPNGKPRNQNLLANISTIRQATLRAFWTESNDIEFPSEDSSEWWEIWLRRDNLVDDTSEDSKVLVQLEAVGAQVANKRLVFPEHIIRLTRGTARQLSQSLVLLDNLAEIRKPKDTTEFFTRISSIEEAEWVEELSNRIESNISSESFAVCILDTGLNNKHILLERFAPDENLDTLKSDWGSSDDYKEGHGTQMAGLSLYGDLFEILRVGTPIRVNHQIESIKIINTDDPNEPELYGNLTEEATNKAYVNAPIRKRLFCMAVTSKDGVYKGIPSSWSSSIDNITFGKTSGDQLQSLFILSGGNVFLWGNPANYPALNEISTIKDPGQSFNGITVGCYTQKTDISEELYPEAFPLAGSGEMGPANSTSLLFGRNWANKPDIVFEGGNLAVQNGSIIDPDSLQLLSTNKNYQERLLSVFSDTSCAAALASKFASEISTQYTDFWPETIRGLMIHSAFWTDQMLNHRGLNELNSTEKRTLLRSYGYGVPDLDRALHSSKSAATLIAQREITPFILEDGRIKTKDMHTFELPFPRDVLEQMQEIEVIVSITLSYFIEPNPGCRNYGNKFRYQSHGLRFKMNNSLETLSEFKSRVNREIRDEDFESIVGSEDWLIGPNVRNKGSVHKDLWVGTASELSTRNLIAIYPVNGWYRTRKKLERYNSMVRYALIVSIEAPEIDIYNPIHNLVSIST